MPLRVYLFATAVSFCALDGFCDLGKKTGKSYCERWGSKGVCLKRILPLAVVLSEKVQRKGKEKKKEKLNTNPSLKYIKTESLFFFLVKISQSLVCIVDAIKIKYLSLLSPACPQLK